MPLSVANFFLSIKLLICNFALLSFPCTQLTLLLGTLKYLLFEKYSVAIIRLTLLLHEQMLHSQVPQVLYMVRAIQRIYER